VRTVVLLVFLGVILMFISVQHFFDPENVFAMVIKQTTEELTLGSERIVSGEVIDIKSEWNSSRTKINTFVKIRVDKNIKGKGKVQDVEIVVPGGTVGDVTLKVSDTPHFILKNKVVVFLESDESDILPKKFKVKGQLQGKFTIKNEKIIEKNVRLKSFVSQIHGIMKKHGLESEIFSPKEEPSVRSQPLPDSLKKKDLHIYNEELGKELKKRTNNKSTVHVPSETATQQAEVSPLSANWVTIMTEDFEGDVPSAGWLFFDVGDYTGEYYWDKDDFMPHTGSYSAWCAKSGANGLDPEYSNYPNYCESVAVYGPFDLSGATAADLTLSLWLESEPSYDTLSFYASIDGSNWYGVQYSGSTNGWISDVQDLTNVYFLGDITGYPSVYIAVIFGSNNSGTHKGAFIDDVILRKYGPSNLPTISNIVPNSASAGTGSPVTISGSNFGAQDTNSAVTFFRRDGDSRNAAITSWSNTSIQCTVPAYSSSGDVKVVTSGGASNGFQFTVTFGYGEHKWADNNLPVPYYINENGTPDCAGEFTAIQNSLQTWSDVTGSYMAFQYEGTTSVGQGYSFDGLNVLSWDSVSNSNTIAVAHLWLQGSNVVENDIVFNNAMAWSDSGEPEKFDVQDIATHELGHSLFLTDLYGTADSEKTMYGFGSAGETKKQTLEPEDEDGIRYIYAGGSPPDAPVLSSGSASPSTGTISTLFTYEVTYTDVNNDPPSSITVSVDSGPANTLSKQTPGDSDYTDGCIYLYQTSGMVRGSHSYHFATSDGTYATTLGPYGGPTVNNSIPSATGLSITPTSPFTRDDLSAFYTYADLDSDSESGSELRWYSNGSLQSTYNDIFTVPSGDTIKDQQWYFTVRPNDGFTFGNLVTSPMATIKNTPPTATDLTITPSSPFTSDDLVTSYTYNDPDADIEVGSEIRWYSDGALKPVYNDTTAIPSSATADNEEWYFTVRPNDGTTFGSLSTSPAVTVQGNDNPLANAGVDQISGAGETVILNGSASYDPDGTIATYKWTRLPDNTVLYSGPVATYDTNPIGRVKEVIELTVTDNNGGTAYDKMAILHPGFEGPQGPEGPKGETGDQGSQGPPGSPPA